MGNTLQIHYLTGFSTALVNRDDTGLAKRINFGGTVRTRVSSQCQKRAWRMNEGPNSLLHLADAKSDIRTKFIVESLAAEIIEEELCEIKALEAVVPDFVRAIFGKKAFTSPGKGVSLLDISMVQASSRPVLLFSGAETRFFKEEMVRAAKSENPKKAAEDFYKEYETTMAHMRASCDIKGGLTAALFGRMVTSDVAANVDGAIHVANAFTVHTARHESDFFTAVDELQPADMAGSAHMGDTDLASSLFYGYVVVDVDALVENLGGDRDLAAEVTSRLVKLIATVSPGAKRGSTAPYAYASTVLVEAGTALPRSLAEAFRTPVKPETHAATEAALAAYLSNYDAMYETGESRAALSLQPDSQLAANQMNISSLADFARNAVLQA